METDDVKLLKSGEPDTLELPTKGTAQESIVQSFIPYLRDDSKARYLGYRCCGFTIREALKLINTAASTLSLWRKDPQFLDLEQRIPEFRDQLGREYAGIEFLRNFRLVMEKDYRVLKRSLDPTIELSEDENSYLLKLRSQYTPQQLQLIEVLINADLSGKGFNFTDFVISESRTERKVEMKR